MSEADTGTTTHSSEKIDAVLMIWGTFAIRYKQSWTSSHPSDQSSIAYSLALNEWCKDITGLRKSDIAKGLEGSKKDSRFSAFAPNSMQFRALCVDSEDEKESLLAELTKWGQLDQSERSQKGLWLVRNMKNYHYFKAFATEIQARKMFDAVYKGLQKHLADGGELPEFHVEIEHVEQPPMAMEKRSSFFADLMKSVDNPQGAQQ